MSFAPLKKLLGPVSSMTSVRSVITRYSSSPYPVSAADSGVQSIQAYQKAVKEVSYEQLERSFRTNGTGIYIIAMVSPISMSSLVPYTDLCCRSLAKAKYLTLIPSLIFRERKTASTKSAISSRRLRVPKSSPRCGRLLRRRTAFV